MKRLLLVLIILFGLTKVKGQTYVSGGIYANTTWTKAASPYIVTDTVVVFPGVTLTIEPGVTVKFDSIMYLEIRDAKFIAEGTITDTIIFTSNSPLPKAGSWESIILHNSSNNAKLDFCKIEYSKIGLNCRVADTFMKNLQIANTLFQYNEIGVRVGSKVNTIIDNCQFIKNSDLGLYLNSANTFSKILNSIFWRNKNGTSANALDGNKKYYNFSNCIFLENETAGNFNAAIIDSSKIVKNVNGLLLAVCFVSNCIVDSNLDIGVRLQGHDTIMNTLFTNNKKACVLFHEFNFSSHCFLFNNVFKNNSTGISKFYRLYNGFHIKKNFFEFNDTGISGIGRLNLIEQNFIENNVVGIAQFDTFNVIKCNKICNNSVYNFCQNTSENIDVTNNDWCTKDSALIRSKLFDGYVDVRYGLINFMPIDTSSCYLGLSINERKQSAKVSIKLYPNPFSQTATLEFENPQNNNHHLSVFNTMGQLVMTEANIKGNKVSIDRKELQPGLYFYQLRDEDEVIGIGKMMIE